MIVPVVIATGVGAAVTSLVAKKEVGAAVDRMARKIGLPPSSATGDALELVKRLDPEGADALVRAWVVAVVAGALASALVVVAMGGK